MATRHLQVLLNAQPVGTLSLYEDARCEFRLLSSYRDAYPRPILGQDFLDDPEKVWRTRARVPAWFSNLLPEGQLREWIAKRAGVHVDREFFLLQLLGLDLPGAVRIVPEDGALAELSSQHESGLTRDAPLEGDWHFSLAGVQLKFSARRQGRGLTIPVRGQNGDWLVKLPDARYPGVPENEHATMRWAALSGIDVPETALVPIDEIDGLPADVAALLREPLAYAVRRFDRPAEGSRVHMEDFAQLLGLYPEKKYSSYGYETIARITLALTGEKGLRQFVRRLVFVAASGNGDAHHKNWTLLYPDGVAAQLSPAYDLVSTIAYQPNDRLALNFARSKEWDAVSVENFERLARKLEVDPQVVVEEAREAAIAIRAAWQAHRDEMGFDQEHRQRLERHLAGVPLLGL